MKLKLRWKESFLLWSGHVGIRISRPYPLSTPAVVGSDRYCKRYIKEDLEWNHLMDLSLTTFCNLIICFYIIFLFCLRDNFLFSSPLHPLSPLLLLSLLIFDFPVLCSRKYFSIDGGASSISKFMARNWHKQ